jgi:hypothetical protein
MGRAIDMEKDIYALKIQVEKLENIVRGMSHQLEEASIPVTVRGEKINTNSKETTHIDLVDDVKNEEDSNDKEKKTNSKGSGKRTKSSDRDGGISKKRSK